MQRDAKVTHFLWNNIDLVGGHQVHLTNKDGSRTLAAIYMHANRLYIAEGTVPEGYPEPGLFQQSLGWIDENGDGASDTRLCTTSRSPRRRPAGAVRAVREVRTKGPAAADVAPVPGASPNRAARPGVMTATRG